MAHHDDEIQPVTRIIAGAIGDSGRRVFVLQACYGDRSSAWVLAKEQLLILSQHLSRLLTDVRSEFPELRDPLVAANPNLDLVEPPRPLFRVGSLGLGYDRVHDLVVLILVDANRITEALEEAAELPATHVYATRGQALLLVGQVEAVITAGRPLCPNCSEPLDSFGHFCLSPQAQQRLNGFLL